MFKNNDRPQYSTARKFRRYELRYPVHVQFPAGERLSEVNAVSRNVSLGGMLLESERAIPPDSPVTVKMVIAGDPLVRPVQLSAQGRVVRVSPIEPGFAIAIECSQPISQMESFLSAAGA